MDELMPPEIQDVMKSLISVIRVVKLYPQNNPIYTQSAKKAFEELSQILTRMPEYHVGIQKTFFTFHNIPFGKDAQINRSIAQDLFIKSVREIVFTAGVSESEILELCQALAMSPEELAMKNGVSSVLWERGVTCIKVTEAGLDDVVTTTGTWRTPSETPEQETDKEQKKEQKNEAVANRTLVLGDLKTDPGSFGEGMLAYAMRTRSGHETVEERLYSLYQQASRKIEKDHAADSEEFFQGLAKSVLAIQPEYRDRLIAGKLFADLDTDLAILNEIRPDQQLPNPLQEVQTGRFSNTWTVEQVATLLKRSAGKKQVPLVPVAPREMKIQPVTPELIEMARSIQQEDADLEALQAITNAGMESDIIESAVRTLTALIPLVKESLQTAPDKQLSLFSGVIRQLEDILSYLLQKNNYEVATRIIKALNMPVLPEFQPRIAEALKKTATKSIIKSTIADMRKNPKGSALYHAAYVYLENLDRKATEALLELLTEEKDRDTRIFLLDLMKDFGRNQITMLSEYLTDDRWYVVRNIVSILAENRTDQAVALLRKAAEHKNPQIRQEVVKALVSTGGKRAASLLGKFVRDEDESVQLLAIRSFPDLPGINSDDAKPLVEFLQERRIGKKEQEATLAAIKVLGRVGGGGAAVFLGGYPRRRWWKSRMLQVELRSAALQAVEEINRRQRQGHDARTK